MALAIVGLQPLQRLVNPSSFGILTKALKKLVYPLRWAAGNRVSACIRTRIRSAGLPTKAPMSPAVSELKAFSAKVRFLYLAAFILSDKVLKSPRRVVP